ncbi:MAG: hypothetical protein ACXVNO_06790 [Bacteroidia bacterium]
MIRRRSKIRRVEDKLIHEVDKILHNSAFAGKNVLENLKHYNKSFEVIDEEDMDPESIFTLREIREIAIKYRLRFVENKIYKYELPYESVLKIEHINRTRKKEISNLKLLATTQFLKNKNNTENTLLFAPTNLGNYYLVHSWGKKLKWNRALVNWPIKNIETLFLSLIIATLVITLCLPTYLITLDRKATYWCAYRIGVFFHLFIFNMGVTAYITFAFSKNLSSSVWNSDKDFG